MKDAIKIAIEALQANQKSWKTLADSGDAGNWKAEEQPVWRQTEDALSIMRGLAEDAEPVGRRVKAEAIHCPVCGFYCLGKGGKTCIDKPALVAAPSPQEAQTEAQEREAFEAWVSREDYSLGTDPIDGEYLFADTHHAWTGFKAGRAGSKP